MDTALGVVGLVVFIVCVISLAAGVTWTVVKLTPRKDQKQQQSAGA